MPAADLAGISIHPPHAGRDLTIKGKIKLINYFNPPSPCGEGHRKYATNNFIKKFQSTLPMRGGTFFVS